MSEFRQEKWDRTAGQAPVIGNFSVGRLCPEGNGEIEAEHHLLGDVEVTVPAGAAENNQST